MQKFRIGINFHYRFAPTVEEQDKAAMYDALLADLHVKAERDGFAPQEITSAGDGELPNPLCLPVVIDAGSLYEAIASARAWGTGAVFGITPKGMRVTDVLPGPLDSIES